MPNRSPTPPVNPAPTSLPPLPRRLERPRAVVLTALIAGALLPLAFAPYNFYPLALISPAFLFWLWQFLPARRAALAGYAFGLGMFGAGVHWVYYSLHDFGNMNAPFAAAMVLLFVAFLSLYPALLGALQARIAPGPARLLWFIPALWTLLEWIRGWFLSGFPWLNLGYSQIDTPLAGIAPVAGVYAVSFVTAVGAALLAATMLWPRYRRHTLAAFVALGIAATLLSVIEWGAPAGKPLRAVLIQGNIPLAQKWDAQARNATLQLYAQLSLQERDADLIVWPETAAPAYLDQIDAGFLAPLRREMLARGTTVVLGAIERQTQDRATAIYNSVAVLSPEGAVYRKRHLVPFGEFLPLSSMLGWLLDYLQIPMSDFSAWDRPQPPPAAAGQRIGISICYEDAFGEELIAALPAATLLINVSEDAWFGDSAAPHQHMQIARMRARETARPLLRATNTGVSAIIDAGGHVLAAAPQFQRDVVRATIQARSGATPYVRWGNWPLLAAILLGSVVARRRAKRR